MISQGISHTAYDVMREYMIIGAELDELPENQRIKQFANKTAAKQSGIDTAIDLDRIQAGSYPH